MVNVKLEKSQENTAGNNRTEDKRQKYEKRSQEGSEVCDELQAFALNAKKIHLRSVTQK